MAMVAWLSKQRIVATGDLVVAPIPFGFVFCPAHGNQDLSKLVAMKPRVMIRAWCTHA
jgi:hypothetical protein